MGVGGSLVAVGGLGVLVGVFCGRGRGGGCGVGVIVGVGLGVDVGGTYGVGDGNSGLRVGRRSNRLGVSLISYRMVGLAVGLAVGPAVGLEDGEAVGVSVGGGGVVGVVVGVSVIVGVGVMSEAPLQLMVLAPNEMAVANDATPTAARPNLSRRSSCA